MAINNLITNETNLLLTDHGNQIIYLTKKISKFVNRLHAMNRDKMTILRKYTEIFTTYDVMNLI
jgi:hypothetical protein